VPTVVTNKGKANIAQGISRTGPVPNWIGWGTGAGVSAATDTTLFAEDVNAGYARVAGVTSQVTITNAGDTFQCVGTITAVATETITNAGLSDAQTAGNLCVKGDFAGVPVNAADSIQFTFQIQAT
jgi:hypothetical protein